MVTATRRESDLQITPIAVTVVDGRYLGGDDSVSGRAKLLYTPTNTFNVLFQYEYLDDEGDSPPAVNETRNPAQLWNVFGFPGVTSGDPLDQAGITNRDYLADGTTPTGLNFSDGHNIDINGFYLNINWELSGGKYQLISATGQREQTSFLPNTYTGK